MCNVEVLNKVGEATKKRRTLIGAIECMFKGKWGERRRRILDSINDKSNTETRKSKIHDWRGPNVS